MPFATRIGRRIAASIVGAWKLAFGALCGTSFLLSFLVVGWAQRVAQREVIRSWWRRRANTEQSFPEFAAGDGQTAEHARWPNWFRGQAAADFSPQVLCSRSCRWKHRWFGSLVRNARLGVQSAFNTAVLLLPGTLLWAVGWFVGWQISFNKVYEQAMVGRTIFGVGMAWFAFAMLYLPLAQARQASTGDWRSFYQFRFIWRLVRRSWLANFGLAVWAFVLSVPLFILKTAPGFWPQISESLAGLSAAEQLQRVERFYFLAALYGVPAFVYFRMRAARVYARAIADGVQSGAIAHEELSDGEWQTLHRLGLLAAREQPVRHWAWRALRWVGTRAGRVTAGVATFLVWLLFTGQIATHEFLKFHAGGRGWWNQPLIQLPWFDYTPAHLREAARAEANE